MDAELVELNARVATLTDAWLAGGEDEVLHRLEAAVAERRAYLQPPLAFA